MYLSTHKLKSIRAEKGWSQEVLAKASGLSVRTIQRVESDGKASSETILAIASVFNISPQELKASNDEIQVQWSRKKAMKNLFAMAVIVGVIVMLLWLGSSLMFVVDLPSALFLILFLYACTMISFGTESTLKSITGYKYLFTDELVGGKQAEFLGAIYASQIKYLYGGALIGATVGYISILSNIESYSGFMYEKGLAVNLIIILYAVVINEGLLRPLCIKLKTCDMKLP